MSFQPLGGMLGAMNVAIMPSRSALKRWVLVCISVMFLTGVLATGVLPMTAAAASQDPPCAEQDHHNAQANPMTHDVDVSCVLACCHAVMVLSQQALSPALTPAPRRAGVAPRDLLPVGRTVAPETPPPIVG